MNKFFFITIFLSMVLGVSACRIFCMEQPALLDSENQQFLDAVRIRINEKQEEVKKILIEIEAENEMLTQKILAYINDGNEQAACRLLRTMEFKNLFQLMEYDKNMLSLLKKERLLRTIRAAGLKDMGSIITEIIYMSGFINLNLIEELVKNGDAEVLEYLLRNGLINKMYPVYPELKVIHGRIYTPHMLDIILYKLFKKSDYPPLRELQALAEQHNQESVVAVLKPYVEASEKSWFSSFFLSN